MPFENSHYGQSVTEKVALEPEGYSAIEVPASVHQAAQRKADLVLRMMQSSFAPEDRAAPAYYRLVASAFPYASRMPHVSLSGNNWNSNALPPTFSMPTVGQPESFCDLSLNNMAAMVQDFMFYAQRVSVILQQGMEFVKEEVDELRTWENFSQTDVSECFHAAFAVQQACALFTEAKLQLEVVQLRCKSCFNYVVCGEGSRSRGDELSMSLEEGDFYGIAALTDEMDMRGNDFPKGLQAFSHPRVEKSTDLLAREIQRRYERLVVRVAETHDRMLHLISIVEGPHGSVFRSMRDYALISQLTRWIKATHVYFATFEPLHAIVIDAEMCRDWQESIAKQWRCLPELMDEVHLAPINASFARALRMPSIQLLQKLKLSYDFSNRTYLRSLLTYGDMVQYRSSLRKRPAAPLCFESGADGVELAVRSSEQIDPFFKQARFMSTPNGLFMANVFNEDMVVQLMEQLNLMEVLRLMFSSRVFYMIASKQSKFWTRVTDLFLVNNCATFPLINDRRLKLNLKFNYDNLPRVSGSVFERHWYPFYQFIATLSTLARQGTSICNICLKETNFRSPMHARVPMCVACYEAQTITSFEIKASLVQKAKLAREDSTVVEWYRNVDVLRTLIPWRFEMRSKAANSNSSGGTSCAQVVFQRDCATLALMQMDNLSRAISVDLTPDLAPRVSSVDLRHVLGGPHAQLNEPRKISLCANFHKYASRQYGSTKISVNHGFDHAGISRFMGDYSKPRRSGVSSFDMTKKHVIVTKFPPEGPQQELVTYPIAFVDTTTGEMSYRVNKPFTVMTASQPPKMCGVVAMHNMGLENYPLCETCYGRCYAHGVNGMMEDTDDSDVEIIEGPVEAEEAE